MSSTKTNAGQFKRTIPRFVEQRFFRQMIVHALVYDRKTRMWHTACNAFGTFPKGYWMPQGGNQPEVTCKTCKSVGE